MTMLSGVTEERIRSMSDVEIRWFDNLKKAFYFSDYEFSKGFREDRCLEELWKAIDTAKTLELSLKGSDVPSKENRKRFIEFIHSEIPLPAQGGLDLQVRDCRSGELKNYSFGALVYEIRCMVHENENLNAAEEPQYHLLIDWVKGAPAVTVWTDQSRIVVSGLFLWERIRQVLAKFITFVVENKTATLKSGEIQPASN